jgi:hypothetical protein
MTRQDMADALLSLLAGDLELHERLFESGLVPRAPAELHQEHLETARVVHTLVHELEINWPGVEVILRMRSELVATRRQVAELAELLRSRRRDEGP